MTKIFAVVIVLASVEATQAATLDRMLPPPLLIELENSKLWSLASLLLVLNIPH